MSAILFGSISTIADTSELQREAFNQAFVEHDVPWHWAREDYRALLTESGGRNRIADYAASVGTPVDATAIHDTKTRLFQQALGNGPVTPRDGVADTIRAARQAGVKIGFVSGTVPGNIGALLIALEPAVRTSDFDLVLDADQVGAPKPDRAAYVLALGTLDERPENSVAIEDNIAGVRSAAAAGIVCVAFPNGNTTGHDFAAADLVVERLDFDHLHALIPGGK